MQPQGHNGRSHKGSTDLTSKVYELVVQHGKDGVLQSKLWKELGLTSRDGSRLAIRLEKRGMIKRDKLLEGGRWTYTLSATRLPVEIGSIEQAPCLTCPVESKCTPEGTISPWTCTLLSSWALREYTEDDLGPEENSPSPRKKI